MADAKGPKCPGCSATMKPLFGAKWFCPDECDLKPQMQKVVLTYPMRDGVFSLNAPTDRNYALDLSGWDIDWDWDQPTPKVP